VFGMTDSQDVPRVGAAIDRIVPVAAWSERNLGSFLFLRIQHQGIDRRFDTIMPSFARFLMAWTLQGLWVCSRHPSYFG